MAISSPCCQEAVSVPSPGSLRARLVPFFTPKVAVKVMPSETGCTDSGLTISLSLLHAQAIAKSNNVPRYLMFFIVYNV